MKLKTKYNKGKMKYFTFNELCESGTAKTHNIDNTPNEQIKINLRNLVDNCLDVIREKYGKPITVSSGYRCPALNKVVGGASTSQHTKGQAADLKGKTRQENEIIFNIIKQLGCYDQLINEYNFSWVHVSYVDGKNNRKQILTIK